MSSTEYPLQQQYNVSLCEKYFEDYRRCPEDGSCRAYRELCNSWPEEDMGYILISIMRSVVFLSLIIFIVVVIAFMINEWKRLLELQLLRMRKYLLHSTATESGDHELRYVTCDLTKSAMMSQNH